MAVEAIRLVEKRMALDMEYARTFPELEERLIGNLLGEGSRHKVYTYGNGQVVKFPKRQRFYQPLDFTAKAEQISRLYEFFPNNCLETQIFKSLEHPWYAVRQRRLRHFQPLTSSLLPAVQNEFTDLVENNKRLQRLHGLSLDFLGKQGLISCFETLLNPQVEPIMSNIVIEKQDDTHLIIIDMNLKRIGERWFASAAFGTNRYKIISQSLFSLNVFFLRHHFGVNIANPKSAVFLN